MLIGARYTSRFPFLALVLCVGGIDLLAQQSPPIADSLAGVVRDASSNLPLSNASVLVQGTDLHTFTDDSGRFSIDGVPEGAQLLQVSRLGYDEEVVTVRVGDASLEVYLEPRPLLIDGVDVTGHSEVALNGAVVDSKSGEGLPWALLRLGDRRLQSADDRGSFRIQGAPPGSYLLYVERLGYESVYVQISLTGGMEPIVVELEPDAIMLQGIETMVRRLEHRRDGYGFGPVRAFDEGRLRRSGPADVESFLRSQGSVRAVEPRVVIDEIEVPCGLLVLTTYTLEDIHLIEIYNRGAQIRVYTQAYMRRTGRGPRALIPANLLPPTIGSC